MSICSAAKRELGRHCNHTCNHTGHQTQLAISQRHPRLVRRKYLDSVSNEGVGTYLEEMLLHAGLFDDQPHTRVDIWRYRRCLLRSSRPTTYMRRC